MLPMESRGSVRVELAGEHIALLYGGWTRSDGPLRGVGDKVLSSVCNPARVNLRNRETIVTQGEGWCGFARAGVGFGVCRGGPTVRRRCLSAGEAWESS